MLTELLQPSPTEIFRPEDELELRRDEINHFLNHLGIRQLSPVEIQLISNSYRQHLINGLDPVGESSLSMIPTRLKPREFNQSLTLGKTAFVVEIGATHIRGTIAEVDQKGNPQIKTGEDGQSLFVKGSIGRDVAGFKDVDDFLDEVNKIILPVLGKVKPDAVSLIYSFGGDAKEQEYGIDVRSRVPLSKGYKIPGIENVDIGKAFLARLKEYVREHNGKSDVDKQIPEGLLPDDSCPMVVLNDTPAVLQVIPGAKIGGVVATGFNLALTVGGNIYNSESGGFSFVRMGIIDRLVDEESGDIRGKYFAEKQISGKYLAEIYKHALRQLILANYFFSHFDEERIKSLTSIDISEILAISDESNLTDAQKEDLWLLQNIAQRIRDRSAQLVRTMIGTAIVTFLAEYLQEEEIIIPIEGDLFWQMPRYREKVERYVEGISGRSGKIRFIEVKNAGILGAAAAALSFLK